MGLCPGPRRLPLGAEMDRCQRKREGPVSDPSRISASGSVLGVLASMFLSPGQLARSVSALLFLWDFPCEKEFKIGT
jgi:hypothetical protein